MNIHIMALYNYIYTYVHYYSFNHHHLNVMKMMIMKQTQKIVFANRNFSDCIMPNTIEENGPH